jgi:uncharacterized protein YndB with AHSA1/START domain
LTDVDYVVREVRIAARPETVFPFFTDPAKMVLWKGIEAQLEPQPGGVYRVRVSPRDVASGRYVEIVPHSRIVFTWGWEEGGAPIPPGASTVEVLFIPDGDGTLVRLTHRDLPPPARAAHGEGWDLFLPRLAIAATGGDPGPIVPMEQPH